MNSRRQPLSHYIQTLKQVLASLEVKVVDVLYDFEDLLVAYEFFSPKGQLIGEITYTGRIKLGDMDFNVEDRAAWQRWQDENYPHLPLSGAIETDVLRAIARVQEKRQRHFSLFSRHLEDGVPSEKTSALIRPPTL